MISETERQSFAVITVDAICIICTVAFSRGLVVVLAERRQCVSLNQHVVAADLRRSLACAEPSVAAATQDSNSRVGEPAGRFSAGVDVATTRQVSNTQDTLLSTDRGMTSGIASKAGRISFWKAS